MHPTSQLPLALVPSDQNVKVLRVHGSAEQRQHLAELGFIENSEVRVVSRTNGNVIVEVKGATIALGCELARKITTY